MCDTRPRGFLWQTTCPRLIAEFPPALNCGRRYLEPATDVATKVGTGRPSGHPRPPGDGGDSCRRRLGYDEPDAGQA